MLNDYQKIIFRLKHYSIYSYLFIIELIIYAMSLLYTILFIHITLYEWDGSNMLFAAESINKTGFYNGFPRAFWPPLYMVLISILNLVTKNYFMAGKLISFFSSIIFQVYSYKFLKTKLTPFFSLLGCTILFSINTIYFNSVGVEIHLLCAAFLVIALYLYQIQNNNKIYLYLIGLFIALASLTRTIGLIFILSIFEIYFFYYLRKMNKSYLKKLIRILVGFFIIYGWLFLYNLIDKGVLFYDYNYLNFALYYSRNQNFWYNKIQQYHSVFDVITKNTVQSHLNHIIFDISTLININIWIFILILILLLISFSEIKKDNNIIEFLIFIINFVIGLILSFISIEFLIPIFPLIVLVFLTSLSKLIDKFNLNNKISLNIKKTVFRKRMKMILNFLIILMIAFSYFEGLSIEINTVKSTELYYNTNFNIKESSQLLNNLMKKNETFMTVIPMYGYYIKAIYLMINLQPVKYLFERFYYSNVSSIIYNTLPRNPTNTNPLVIANYIIIDQLIEKNLPDLSFLYLPQNRSIIPPYLIPVKTFSFTSIYEVNQTLIRELIAQNT